MRFLGGTFEKVPPHPLKTFLTVFKDKFVTHQTDSRRERKVRFCYRERVIATKTLLAQKVVCMQKQRNNKYAIPLCLSVSSIPFSFFVRKFLKGVQGETFSKKFPPAISSITFSVPQAHGGGASFPSYGVRY